MKTELASANGEQRYRDRAWLDGWQVADRTTVIMEDGSPPWRYVDLDMEPTTPANGVLLACFLRGMFSRFGMATYELEEILLRTLDYKRP